MRLFVRDNGARRCEPLIVVTRTVRAAKEGGIRSPLWNRELGIIVSHNARAYIQVAAKRLSYPALLIAISCPVCHFPRQKCENDNYYVLQVTRNLRSCSLIAVLAALYTFSRGENLAKHGQVLPRSNLFHKRQTDLFRKRGCYIVVWRGLLTTIQYWRNVICSHLHGFVMSTIPFIRINVIK